MLLFIAIGYILCKSGIVDKTHSRLLSVLWFYIFLPANVFKTFSNYFTVEYLSEKYPLVLICAVFVAVMMLAGIPVSRLMSKDNYQQAVYRYSLISSNYGYVGYTLAQSIFGEQMLMNVMMFAVPLSVYTYSVGYCMLTRNKLSFRRLLNPVNIALVGLLKPYAVTAFTTHLTGFTAWIAPICAPVADFINNFLNKAQACMGSIRMLLTGMVISGYKLKDMLSQKPVYVMTALRLVVIPFAVCGLLRLLGLKDFLTPTLIMLALPCGLNTIVFPKLVGEDCKTGAALACLTSVLCCVTIPLCLHVFGVY